MPTEHHTPCIQAGCCDSRKSPVRPRRRQETFRGRASATERYGSIRGSAAPQGLDSRGPIFRYNVPLVEISPAQTRSSRVSQRFSSAASRSLGRWEENLWETRDDRV